MHRSQLERIYFQRVNDLFPFCWPRLWFFLIFSRRKIGSSVTLSADLLNIIRGETLRIFTQAVCLERWLGGVEFLGLLQRTSATFPPAPQILENPVLFPDRQRYLYACITYIEIHASSTHKLIYFCKSFYDGRDLNGKWWQSCYCARLYPQ